MYALLGPDHDDSPYTQTGERVRQLAADSCSRPASARRPQPLGSRKDAAAKELRRLAGPHLPATLSRLERAIKRAHAAHEKAEQAGRRSRETEREPATNTDAMDAPTDVAPEVADDELEDEAA